MMGSRYALAGLRALPRCFLSLTGAGNLFAAERQGADPRALPIAAVPSAVSPRQLLRRCWCEVRGETTGLNERFCRQAADARCCDHKPPLRGHYLSDMYCDSAAVATRRHTVIETQLIRLARCGHEPQDSGPFGNKSALLVPVLQGWSKTGGGEGGILITE